MTTTREVLWRQSAAVAGLIVLWFAATAWMRPLMLPDEGRYVGVAWEMMRSGDWLTPTLNGLPFFHKPPLFYWITAASMALFGLHEGAARAASVLGASLGAFALYLFVRRWLGERAARLTLVALLVQPLYYLGGQFANLDMLVTGFITVTIVLLAHAALCFERKLGWRGALAAAYAMAALGVLAKGLIGLVIPALVVAAWLLALRRLRTLKALLWWPGVGLFLLVAAPWFVAMQQRHPDFLNYFFVVQHFKRFAAGGFNNEQPFWFYLAVLLLFSLPWLPWLSRLCTREFSSDPGRAPIRVLTGLWVVLVLLFFSLPKSKLIGYILPAVPPLAVLMAEGFLQVQAAALHRRRWWNASAGVSVVLGIGVVVGLALFPRQSSRELAFALGAARGQGEPVFMLNQYLYDVPIYARIQTPIQVVDDWQGADVRARDNWRKELADAGQFAGARAQRLLIAPASFPAAVCSAKAAWVIGPPSAGSQYPVLLAATVVFAGREATLWRVDPGVPEAFRLLRCEGTPNGGSADK